MDIPASPPLPPTNDWTLIGKGKSSQVFRTGNGEVVKLFHDAVSEEMIQREMMAASLAAERGLSTAAPRARISVGQQRAIIYPEVVGQPMAAAIRQRPFAASALLGRMAQLHHAIHEQEGGTLRTVKSVLRTDIDYGPADATLKKAAIDYLGRLPGGTRLLHGDLHIDNIILCDDRPVVLDWAKAAMGDPAADVVRSEMLMRYGDGPRDPVMILWRAWAARGLWKGYRDCGGMAGERLTLWRPVVALAWLRARPSVRNRAFHAYLNRALQTAGLPEYRP